VRPITIGDYAWLPLRIVVLPGVAIGYGAVVGTGSVVTHDVPPHTVVAGNPARVIGTRREVDFTYVPSEL
jgi:acetyltransferase-like isoleucine patch superfamily enzyme